jgi:hypothetical protein
MVTTKRVLSLLVIATSACGMVSCDSTLDGTVFTSAANHSVVVASGANQSALPGQALPNPIVVKILDTSGNPVANEYVLATVASGGGTVSVPNSKSGRNGEVTIFWSLGAILGADILNVSISDANGNFTNSPNVNVPAVRISSPASSANSSIVGTGPNVLDGVSTSTITVTLLDSNHEPLIGVVPTFSATGTNTYFPCTPVNALGTSTCAMGSSSLGTKTLSITSPITMASGTVKFISGAPSVLTVVGSTNNLLSVLLKDAYSNIVSNQQIDWTITGGGILAGANSTTDGTGAASNTFTSASSGVQTITASVHGYPQVPPVTFSFVYGTWTFVSGNTAAYTLGTNIDFTAGNVCELTPFNLPDNSSANYAAGTAIGVTYGTLSDGVSQGFKLGASTPGACDGSLSACAPNGAFSESWAPSWNNLVALWHFDEVLGSPSALDSSSSGISSGVVSGGVIFGSSGKQASAANFNGSGQIAIADNASVGVNGNMTLSAWVQTTGSFMVAWKNQHYGLYVTNGQVTFASSNNWNFGATGYYGSGLSDGNWHHVVVVVTSGIGYQFYADGVNVGSFSTAAALADNGSTLYLGSQGGGGYTSGNLDELAVWNVALSASDVQTIYTHQIQTNGLTHTGIFTSRVMDAKQSLPWTSLSWLPTLPFGKALPDNAVSESISNYSSLANSSLMSGIVGLWHLDETSGTMVADSSGSGKSGTLAGGVTLGATGKIANAANFNGTNGYVALPVLTTQATSTSMSAWFKSNNFRQPRQMIFYNGSDAGGNGYGLALNNENDSSGLVRVLYGGVVWFNNKKYVTDSNWHHVLLVIAADAHPILYLDGALVFTGSSYQINTPTVEADIGRDNFGNSSYFYGSLDEVAMWTRMLSATEVQQLYQRGVSRVKFQVHSCAQADCSDGTWQGPDGTSSSYYSELNNTSAGTVNAGLPSMTFANFATPTPAPNRYFQYRAIFESDSASTALMPEVKSVTIGPQHFDATSPSVVGHVGVTIPILSSFTQTLGSNGCTSATYNLGIGTSSSTATWYYWSGSAWTVAGGTTATSSSAAAINTNLVSFPTVGSNTVYFKAYLNSNGSTPCELQEVQLNGHN